MAFVPEFACGFELGMVPVEAGLYSGLCHNVTTGAYAHTGTYGMRFQANTFYFHRRSPGSTLDLSIWVTPHGSGTVGLYMIDGGLVELRYNGTSWDLYVDGSLAASGSVVTTSTAYQHIQLRANIAASGTFATRIEGVDDIDYSGNLIPDTSDDIERVYFYGPPYSCIDDLVFGTGGWPNDLRVDPLYLDADSGTPEWTPSTGTDNYACVDDVPPSADYVYTDADARDLYSLADWDDTDGSGNVIKNPVAVVLWAQVREEDGSRDDKLRFLQSDGANEVQSSYTSVLTSYQNLHYLRTAAPGGGAWDKAGIDALLLGVEADMV